MNSGLWISLLFCTVYGQQDLWPDAVIEIIGDTFNRPVVLFLDSHDFKPRRRTLAPSRDSAKRARILSVLAKNFSLTIADRKYVRPDEDLIRYKLGLVNAGQIVIFLGERTASYTELLRKDIKIWQSNAVWFSRAKIIVIIESEKNGYALARQVITELWREVKSANLLVLTAWGENVDFYSFIPYDTSCEVVVRLVGKWNGTYKNVQAFPQWPFKNLNKCSLHATAVELVPYVFPPDENGDFNEGIEVRIFQQLSNILNFTYKFVATPEGENPWLTVVNGTPAGFIGMLTRGESDIVLSGGRLNYERTLYVDPLDSHITEDFVWVGPAPQRTPRWKAVFLVFSPTIWLGIGVTFAISACFSSLIYKKNRSESALLVIWAFSLSNIVPCRLLPNSSVVRCFLGFFLFYTLTINSLYTSALYGVMTNGLKLYAIESNDEAADLGMTASIFASNIPDLKETVPDYYRKITKNNLVIWSNDYLTCFRRAVETGDCYTLFTGLGARYQINLRFTTQSGRRYVRIMKQRYKTYEPTIYMTKHHPLYRAFSKTLRQLIENGLIKVDIDHIMVESLRQRTTHSEVKELSEQEERKTLGVDQILGAFLITSLIMTLAIFSFIAEVLTHAKRKNATLLFIN